MYYVTLLILGYPRNIFKNKLVNIFTESLGVQVQVNEVALLMLYYITFTSLLYTIGTENMAFITLVEF